MQDKQRIIARIQSKNGDEDLVSELGAPDQTVHRREAEALWTHFGSRREQLAETKNDAKLTFMQADMKHKDSKNRRHQL